MEVLNPTNTPLFYCNTHLLNYTKKHKVKKSNSTSAVKFQNKPPLIHPDGTKISQWDKARDLRTAF